MYQHGVNYRIVVDYNCIGAVQPHSVRTDHHFWATEAPIQDKKTFKDGQMSNNSQIHNCI